MASDTETARTRTIVWDDPVPVAAAGAAMSGLEYLRAMAAGTVPRPPVGALIGMGLEEVASGRVVFSLEPAEYHYNPIGVVHGGIAATLLDSAMGCAVHSTLPEGRGYTSLEIKVNYVRALTRDTGVVRCEGTVLYVGGKVATAEGHIVDADGRLYAHGTTTCLIFPTR